MLVSHISRCNHLHRVTERLETLQSCGDVEQNPGPESMKRYQEVLLAILLQGLAQAVEQSDNTDRPPVEQQSFLRPLGVDASLSVAQPPTPRWTRYGRHEEARCPHHKTAGRRY
jgi:hypothetical protein